ncbi:MAG: 8-oxo-dGTP diphosphatase [Oscillospiraceae bacterium]|nr:8-oxo-dGTP diphosphatase [Oscillospiraceae bacterium]
MKNTSLCYIEQNGAYLLLHRVKKEHDENRDKWIGIGGHFEENESPEECVIREALEETGLMLRAPRYCGIVTFVSDRWEGEYMHLFHAQSFSGSLKDCDEGVLEWVPKETVRSLPQWAGDRIFLDLMERRVPFFSLKLRYRGETLREAVLNGVNLEISQKKP